MFYIFMNFLHIFSHCCNYIMLIFFSLCFARDTFSLFITQTGFELLILLPQPPMCLDYKCASLNIFVKYSFSFLISEFLAHLPISIFLVLLICLNSLEELCFKKVLFKFSFIAFYLFCIPICVCLLWCFCGRQETTWCHFSPWSWGVNSGPQVGGKHLCQLNYSKDPIQSNHLDCDKFCSLPTPHPHPSCWCICRL